MPNKIDDNYSYLNKIACDTEVHLQIITPTLAVRLKTRLIGVDPNMSVIVAIGNDGEWLSAKKYIFEGQKVIVRLISTDTPDANIVAFKSNIQKLMSIAGRWLLLDYPREVQQLALRQHMRLPVHFEAKLLSMDSKKTCASGFLNDISPSGGAFVGDAIKHPSDVKKYILQVLDNGKTTEIPVCIKNTKRTNSNNEIFQYGLVIEADEKKAKQFVEPLLVHSLFS